MNFVRFLSYHNAVPIALGIVFMGAGGVFAATNPDMIIAAEQTVVSIDNSYIANKDLANYTPQVQITGVTEDDTFYFVAYTFSTIGLSDGVWRDVEEQRTMKVAKDDLGAHRDLGLYVTEQLTQIIERELAYLREVQTIERRQISQKVVATAYSGLVGAFLSNKTEAIPGYVPVVTPPPEPIAVGSNGENESVASAAGSAGTKSSADAPVIQILGNNPARIPVGAAYADLGAIVRDNRGMSLGVEKFVDGIAVQTVEIDTSTTSMYTVTYSATDTNRNTASRDRIVIVYDDAVPGSRHEEIADIPNPSVLPRQTVQQNTPTEPQENNTSEEEPVGDVPVDPVETESDTETSEPDAIEDPAEAEAQAEPEEPTEETGGTDTPEEEEGSSEEISGETPEGGEESAALGTSTPTGSE